MKLIYTVLIAVFSTASLTSAFAKDASRKIASTQIPSGFICIGPKVYTQHGVLQTVDSPDTCQLAVDNSANGFICIGTTIYTSEGTALADGGTSSMCQYAVNHSK
jgi:hypothetical protein